MTVSAFYPLRIANSFIYLVNHKIIIIIITIIIIIVIIIEIMMVIMMMIITIIVIIIIIMGSVDKQLSSGNIYLP